MHSEAVYNAVECMHVDIAAPPCVADRVNCCHASLVQCIHGYSMQSIPVHAVQAAANTAQLRGLHRQQPVTAARVRRRRSRLWHLPAQVLQLAACTIQTGVGDSLDAVHGISSRNLTACVDMLSILMQKHRCPCGHSEGSARDAATAAPSAAVEVQSAAAAAARSAQP